MDFERLLANETEFNSIWKRVEKYTMTSKERGFALYTAVKTIIGNNIPGAFVECGTWKGGSAMLIALTLQAMGEASRQLYLFDTFAGMTTPGALDIDINGQPAAQLIAGSHGADVAELVRAAASLQEVACALESTGYDMRLIRFVKGDVCETLPKSSTLRIALLRLDTDFYESTIAELKYLYPRVAQGGIIIIDDYGHWQGAQKAVDDFFADASHPFSRPMLWAIDYTGRGGVKIDAVEHVEIERYDYVPPGLTSPNLLSRFRHAEVGNPWKVDWPYLRREVPHLWRFDNRHRGWVTGYASVEEAICLYTLACQFRGKRGVEIGTHYGWTAAHLLAGGLNLDCIDPAISEEGREQAIKGVLDTVPTSHGYRLWAERSPQIVKTARDSQTAPWSFAFIDGNHDGDGPFDDAREILKYLAEDAVVVFHDLTSPDVERGLRVFKDAGFKIELINTMQILGVAYRGDVEPLRHQQDSNVPPIFADHLEKYL